MRSIQRIFGQAVLAGMVLAPAGAYAQAQPAPNTAPAVVQTFLRDIDGLERKLVGLAEAIPEEKYDWRPGEGVRSVAEVMMHVAADNYFLPTIAGVEAPAATGIKAGDYPSVQAYEARKVTRAEAITALRESFAHLETAMQQADEALLARQLSVFGQQMSGLDLWFLTAAHLHEHLGQAIAYARTNGVVPPWSRGN